MNFETGEHPSEITLAATEVMETMNALNSMRIEIDACSESRVQRNDTTRIYATLWGLEEGVRVTVENKLPEYRLQQGIVSVKDEDGQELLRTAALWSNPEAFSAHHFLADSDVYVGRYQSQTSVEHPLWILRPHEQYRYLDPDETSTVKESIVDVFRDAQTIVVENLTFAPRLRRG